MFDARISHLNVGGHVFLNLDLQSYKVRLYLLFFVLQRFKIIYTESTSSERLHQHSDKTHLKVYI